MKKSRLPKLSILFLSILTSGTVWAQHNTATIDGTTPLGPSSQYRTWSLGVNGGLLSQSSTFGFDDGDMKAGYSAYLKKHFTPSFGLKLQYLGGQVGGVASSTAAATDLETKLPWSVALSGELVAANVNWRVFNAKIKPYLSAGIGAISLNTVSATTDDSQTRTFVPVDGGFKFAIAKGINLDLG
jgi:OOP family OmpA-OmpF porin